MATDQLWSALAAHLASSGVITAPRVLERHLDAVATWCHPRLLLSQACEYPLATSFASRVRLVATPCYGAPGCTGDRYCSALVVRRDDPAATLGDLRQRRCVINERDSNSGMNLLRAAIAPLAGGKPFFTTVTLSGAHRRSLQRLLEGEADVTAIDCVSWAHLQRIDPISTAELKSIGWTPSTPSLPFITAQGTSDATLSALRAALLSVLADPAMIEVREQLLLTGFNVAPREGFAEVLALERQSVDLGYPVLV